jgi:hypothetical protein
MNPNWQQSQYGGYQQQHPTGQYGGPGAGGFMGAQPTGFMGQPQQQQQQQPMQSMQTGFGGHQRPMGSNVSPLPTGQTQQQPGGGNYSFLNTQPTGFRPSFTGSSGSGLAPQMTGYPGGGASGLLSQPTGYGGGSGMMSQPTGMGMGMGGGGMMSQPTGMGGGMMSQPTGMGGGLMSQSTGMGGLRAQPTGVHDPRLQSMMQSFMPSNTSQVSPNSLAPWRFADIQPFTSSGMPQFQTTQQPLQQQFQSLIQNPSVKTPKVPWVLTKQEKKDYDQIFKAWDTDQDGFITGETAREVFGQSGLDQDGLMKIWYVARSPW